MTLLAEMKNILCIKFYLAITLFLLLFSVNEGFSQETDFGIWSSFKIEKELSKRIGIEFELGNRWEDNVTKRDENFAEAGINFSKKIFATGLLYRFSNENKKNTDTNYHRLSAEVKIKPKINRFEFQYRGRAQYQFNEPTEDIQTESYLRNKFALEYDIKGIPLKPSLGYEFFYKLTGKSSKKVEKERYSVGLDYKFSKKYKLGIAYYLNNRIQEEEKNTILNIEFKIDI